MFDTLSLKVDNADDMVKHFIARKTNISKIDDS